MGRRRIEIKKIENLKARNVCFSKRRKGLFKKAEELYRLCDIEVAVLVFSPAGKPYFFGNNHRYMSLSQLQDCSRAPCNSNEGGVGSSGEMTMTTTTTTIDSSASTMVSSDEIGLMAGMTMMDAGDSCVRDDTSVINNTHQNQMTSTELDAWVAELLCDDRS